MTRIFKFCENNIIKLLYELILPCLKIGKKPWYDVSKYD